MPPTVTATKDALVAGSGDLGIPSTPGDDGASLPRSQPQVGADLGAALRRAKAKGKAGEVVTVPDGERSVHLVGVGDGSPRELRKAAAALARAAKDATTLTTSLAAGRSRDEIQAVAEAIGLATYSFDERKTTPSPSRLEQVLLTGVAKPGDALDRAAAVVAAVHLCRDLVNAPSMEKTPAWLADKATRVAKTAGLTIRVRDEAELRREGFGGITAVGMGSARPPRLIELSYAPAGAKRHVVLVGKGITFDSGGLSIKPNDGMVSMKTDMAGGAVVIAVMSALKALGAKVRVTGLVAAAENMPSGSAQRPGDVIRQYGGTTVEVLNTDAEGRLVLADALAYAAAQLNPDVMVDFATLTGAASLGLGRIHGALFSNSDRLAAELLAASDAGGEQTWRMPLVEEYRFTLDSDIADLRNIGDPEHFLSGGAITAALFLREFVAGLPWAHLDIAGPARAEKDDGEITKGGSGYGVRTLLRWLAD